ncbi:PepSY domain-containing protein [Streptomyces sp. NPDC048484]|uniref:PepSY domain-containing protein n=1 Tax=Streptomyces sp. NPDC048484 TaxID=3155146 RepID=UPI0034155AC2
MVCAPLLAGCGDGGDSGEKQSVSATASGVVAPSSASSTGALTEDQRERKALLPDDKTGYREAARIATGEVPGGTLTKIELKRDAAGKAVWESTVAEKDGAEHEVNVDAASGKVVQSRTESDQDADDKRKLSDRLSDAKISSQQAVKKATAEETKGTVTSVELDDTDDDTDDDTTIWSVDLVTTEDWNKTTYDVDATNGKILRTHVDRD